MKVYYFIKTRTMSIFVRMPNYVFKCTKRMLHDAINTKGNSKIPSKISKFVDSRFIGNNDVIIINKKLKNNERIADSDWIEIRKELLNTYKSKLSETTVDSLVYDLCEYHKRSDQAKNYYKFLKRNHYEISLNILGRYLRFLSKRKVVTKAEEEEIYKIYDQIREKYSLLDSTTCRACIAALAITKRWKEAFKILDMLQLSDSPGQAEVCVVCKAAFRENEPELAWKLMNEYIPNFPMTHEVYTDYLEYCKRNFKDQNLIEAIEKVFYFWRDNYIAPVHFVLEDYMKIFSTLGYTTSFTSISFTSNRKEGKCSKCNTILQKTELSESEFKTLSQAVLKKLIIGQNIYQSASPQELKRYLLFIKTLKPYDVIIDGLNVAYTTVTDERRGSLDNILQVVNEFRKNKKRVLVIGRAHMNWWSTETMKKIEEAADVFLLKNISKDDIFLLHLAFVSGPQTYFVSGDSMFEHIYQLEDYNLMKLFKNWQLSRQYAVIQMKNTSVRLIPPVPVSLNAQKIDDGWHIPCTKSTRLLQSRPELWACLMKKESLEKL